MSAYPRIVLLRFPALNASNPANDWKLASDRGFEIQIDNMGFNPDTGQNFSPLHQTGAVYALGAVLDYRIEACRSVEYV